MTAEEREHAITQMLEQEAQAFQARTPRSYELCRTAVDEGRMPLGMPTNVGQLWPYPITMRHGAGSQLVDADGNHYTDWGAGYGALPFGHAHPAIISAIEAQAVRGTHFGALTEPVIDWARHLAGRFGLDWVRFSASGTEATLDAVRVARAYTQRPIIVKCEGAYHGSHPDALNSINQPLTDESGPDNAPRPVAADESVPRRVTDQDVRVVAFNDLAAAERALTDRQAAALIIEPIMFNVGFIWPQDGYLAGLRELCESTGTLLIFDEVKTGATVAWGGAEQLFGVKPDLKCFAKTVAGGLPGGCFGGTDDRLFDIIESSRMMHVGTLSGNPLTAAAGHAALARVLTPAAYEHLGELNERMRSGMERIIAKHDLAAYVTGVGAKGCLVWADPAGGQLRDFRDYWARFDKAMADVAFLHFLGEGHWLAPGHDEQYTLMVAHTESDVDSFLATFARLADKLVARGLAARD